MADYRITWAINEEADSPQEAIRMALADLPTHPGSIATIFNVETPEGKIHIIDSEGMVLIDGDPLPPETTQAPQHKFAPMPKPSPKSTLPPIDSVIQRPNIDILNVRPADEHEPQWQDDFLILPKRISGKWVWGRIQHRIIRSPHAKHPIRQYRRPSQYTPKEA